MLFINPWLVVVLKFVKKTAMILCFVHNILVESFIFSTTNVIIAAVNRPAGRPRTSCLSRIVRDTGLTTADAWAVADDRSTWRALRPTAGYAQH